MKAAKKPSISMILQPVIGGCFAALMSMLLIYFKQKPIFHHGAVILIGGLFYSGIIFIRQKVHFSNNVRNFVLVLLTMICWLGPQTIYQERPHTFYISGLALATILLVLFVEEITLKRDEHSFSRDFLLFLLTYAGAYFLLSISILQNVTIALSVMYMAMVIFERRVGKIQIILMAAVILAVFMVFRPFFEPMKLYRSQEKYEDKIVFEARTQHHDLVITQWKNDFWFYVDGLKNFSSIDEYLYSEPMVHSLFSIKPHSKRVLVLGGENGCLLREILKYPVSQIDVVCYDTLMRNLAIENHFFTMVNAHAYDSQKVHKIHENVIDFCASSTGKYDAVFIDLPDPRSVEENQFYTLEFYNLIGKLLEEDGVMITQAGSPLFATRAFFSIKTTLEKAGFHTLPLHNQILTLGEWGWMVCSTKLSTEQMKQRINKNLDIPSDTQWYNRAAAEMVTSFGKVNYDTAVSEINRIKNPLVYRYYLQGTWNLN